MTNERVGAAEVALGRLAITGEVLTFTSGLEKESSRVLSYELVEMFEPVDEKPSCGNDHA